MKNLKKVVFFIVAILFSLNVYSQEYYGSQKEIQKILKNVESFSQYYMDGDAAKLADCYTADGKIFPGKVDIIGGREKLQEFWTLSEGVQVLHHKVTPSEIRIVKKYAYDYGYYEGVTSTAKGESSWRGKYVIVWRKVGKDWKIYLDIWNRIDDPEK